MKLCIIFPHYPPNYRMGGIEDYTQILVGKFRGMGIQTSVIASNRYTGDDKNVFKINDSKWGFNALKAVIKIISDEKFDLVVMQYTPDAYGYGISFKFLPLCLKFIKKAPFFMTTFHTLTGGKGISKLYAFMLTLFSHKVISTNEDLTFLFKKYLGLFNSKLEQIPIGSNISRTEFDKDKIRSEIAKEMKISQKAVWLSNFGFTIPNKGIEDLFAALAKLAESGQKYYLFMITALRDCDHLYREELMEIAKKLKIDQLVLWINESSDEDVSKFLTASDIFVAPYKDGICTRRGTLMAAIVHRLPIVSTNPRVFTPYFKNEENVLLVDPGNPMQLAMAIDKLSKDDQLKEKLSSNIALLEKHFDWNQIAYKIIAVYGKGLKSLGEKMRYAIKISFESLEFFFFQCLVLKPKKQAEEDLDILKANPSQILLIQLNSIGDVLMTTPALKSLKKRFPKAKIDILTLPHTGILLNKNPNVNRVFYCVNSYWRLFPFQLVKFNQSRQTINEIKRQKYDLCIDFNATFASGVLSNFISKGIKVGLKRDIKIGVFKKSTSDFYSFSIIPTKKHIIENNLLIVNNFGGQDSDLREEIFVNDENEKTGRVFLHTHALEGKKYVVIHPGAKWPPKRWPATYFGRLIYKINAELNMKSILVGGSDEKDLLESIRLFSRAEPIISCGDLDLLSMGKIIKDSHIFIGNDSGISHIAASVGAKIIVLFGPTDPESCLPQGVKVEALKRSMPCWPCTLYFRRNECEISENVCMHAIGPDIVMEKVKSLCA